MKNTSAKLTCLLILLSLPASSTLGFCLPALAQPETAANTTLVPTQILKTGININSTSLSPNTQQLAAILKMTNLLETIHELRSRVDSTRGQTTLESLALRQDLTESIESAMTIIEEANLGVDFVLAEIQAEENLTAEVHSSLAGKRDRLVNISNETSFITNGALWAIGEAFDIPTWKRPKYSIPSGTVSILAGVIPSIASTYALMASSGKKLRSEKEPNMLAKIFDEPTNPEIEYPSSVWEFLTTVPPGDKKTRRDQLIDRWIADSNIPGFTNRNSRAQVEIVTASAEHRKGLSIDSLNTRHVMLSQLAAEVMKMKRMLLELVMVVRAEKRV
jgi:hypothetical protein